MLQLKQKLCHFEMTANFILRWYYRPPASMRDRTIDAAGEVNYLRKVFLNENACKLWRQKIGTNVSRDLNYPGDKEWYIYDWVRLRHTETRAVQYLIKSTARALRAIRAFEGTMEQTET